MPESSWAFTIPPSAGFDGTYANPTVKRNATISGGTSLTFPSQDSATTTSPHIALARILRRVLNARAAGTITASATIAGRLANDGSGNFTTTAVYGSPSLSGGTAITLPTYTETTGKTLYEIYQRGVRAILDDRAAGN